MGNDQSLHEVPEMLAVLRDTRRGASNLPTMASPKTDPESLENPSGWDLAHQMGLIS